jgi:UDP-3-O-[3-hydroxymyristoyl] glucosamine N-acyltransferase
VRIGDGCTIGPGTVLGDDVVLGEGRALAANVSIRERCTIGRRAVMHSGAVIGARVRLRPTPDGVREGPQRVVVIEDGVEIGDDGRPRSLGGASAGVKLDNLVQVAHNVYIGEHTVIAGQSGISGSTRIGRYCRVAGQVGFAGHLEIADHTTFAAQTGVPKSLLKAGETYFGTPAKEFHRRARIEAALTELPELLVQVRSLKETLDRLERELAQLVQRSMKR